MYVKLSSKYQITIPKDIREKIGLEAGDKLFVSQEGDKIILSTISKVKSPTKLLYGSIKSDKDAVEEVRKFRESGGR